MHCKAMAIMIATLLNTIILFVVCQYFETMTQMVTMLIIWLLIILIVVLIRMTHTIIIRNLTAAATSCVVTLIGMTWRPT